jgi:hypothetical protein
VPRRTRTDIERAARPAHIPPPGVTPQPSEPHTIPDAADFEWAPPTGADITGAVVGGEYVAVNESHTVEEPAGLRALPVRRRCGTRHARGVYVEGLVASTMQACLFDPPLTLAEVGAPTWFQPHRTPLTFERDGVTHFVVWVGEEYYPSVHDFIEEVRAAGASRKLPPHFDFSRVTDESRMFFVHPRARVTIEGSGIGPNLAEALYDARPTEVTDEGGEATRELPCGHVYTVRVPPAGTRVVAEPGLFMQLGITGIAMVNDHAGTFPPQVEERVRRARVPVFRSNH